MRDVAIVSFASTAVPRERRDEVEMLAPVLREAVSRAGVAKEEIGFTVSGSCDYLGGRPFSFVMALDAVGAWPPIAESHVEMDGAWALYEAWVRLQHGDIDVALVYAFGKSSQGKPGQVFKAQYDPYTLGVLGPDPRVLAGLQARAMIDRGVCDERAIAARTARNRGRAGLGDASVDELLGRPYVASPLREADCAPSLDAAAAIVLVAGERAKKRCAHPAWIAGIDHRADPQALGARDLVRVKSAEIAGERSGARSRPADVAELDAPYTHQELLLERALGLGAGTDVNPSGGAAAGHAFIVAGLLRMGAAAQRIHAGEARRTIAHATSGPCLQQNLVCVLERRP